MSNPAASTTPAELPLLTTAGPWDSILTGDAKTGLEQILPGYLLPRRWFGSKARTIAAVRLAEAIPLDLGVYLTLIDVHFTAGQPETYVLPLAFATGEEAEQLRSARPNAVIAGLHTAEGDGVLYDAVWNKEFDTLLLEAISHGRTWQGADGDIAATPTVAFSWLRGDPREALTPHVLGVEQSNTNVRYGKRLLLKLFRRLETGANPDQEIGSFLTEKVAFPNVPPVAGALEYRRQGAEPISLGLLQGFVANQGDAWRYTLDSLDDYFTRTRASYAPPAWVAVLPQEPLLTLASRPVPKEAAEAIGSYLDSARLLARRTAELHLALASQPEDPVFGLEPFSPAYRQHLQRDMHKLAETIFQLLRQHIASLPAASQETARQVLALEESIVQNFDALLESDISALRQRIHGDYHLGQVLYTGDDFMIIDFEGEPARPLSERRQKGSPLQDVAGMLRSFHYAAYAAYFHMINGPDCSAQTMVDLEAWARCWHLWVSVAYLQTYLEVADGAPFIPAERGELKALLDAYLLSKAVYELGYELNNRPHWVAIPLQGIVQTAQAVQ